MEGLGRRDLLLRGSQFWRCGKCDFERNFSNRTKCHQCGQRPPQWILDAQIAKVREIGKTGGRAGGPAGAGAGGGAASVPSKQEYDKLRAELAALKAAAAASAPAKSQSQECKDTQCDSDAKDQEYQAALEDLENQLVELRRMAKDHLDPSFLNTAIAQLEAKAAAVRAERRGTWSAPRLLERHRARVAERVLRVDKAKERVAGLQQAMEKLQSELAEAEAHLEAKEEDLACERAEVARLEAQLPKPSERAAGQAAGGAEQQATKLDGPSEKQSVIAGLRKLAAAEGGVWTAMLAYATAGNATDTKQDQAEDNVAKVAEQRQDDPMDGAGQNALVPKAAESIEVAASSGLSLAMVPKMGGTVRPQSADGARAPKARRV